MRHSAAKADKKPAAGSDLPADSLALGVTFMLAMTVLQRVIGFGRGIIFCRLLSDDELGQWSLAFSFLLLAAPLAVLGLPGSFGRYAQHYHQKNQLRTFLWRTSIASGVLALLGVLAVFFASESIAWVIFKDPAQSGLVKFLAVALAAAVSFNFVNELFVALRQSRTSACMQFTHSLIFSILGVSLAAVLGFGAWSLAAAYIVACVAGVAVAMRIGSRQDWRGRLAATEEAPLGHADLWRKLLPFAAWVWVINLLTNLFDAADRYMILHLAPLDAHAAQGVVGQYHSSRVLPLLLVSVAGMFGGILLPYMSHDWEAGRRCQVGRRLALTFKGASIALSAAGVGILLIAPWLFTWALAGRYTEGLSVLPGTTVYCIWFSLIVIGQNYLWCAEQAKLASAGLFLGLLLNVLLNYLLAPIWGLAGAVTATAVANAAALVLLLWFSRRAGMPIDRGVLVAAACPGLLLLGPLPAAIGLLIVVLLGMGSEVFFNAADREQMREAWTMLRQRFLGSAAPLPASGADTASS